MTLSSICTLYKKRYQGQHGTRASIGQHSAKSTSRCCTNPVHNSMDYYQQAYCLRSYRLSSKPQEHVNTSASLAHHELESVLVIYCCYHYYLAIWQVCIARDVAELLIAKLANTALELQASEGSCHAPEPNMPSPCKHTQRFISW